MAQTYVDPLTNVEYYGYSDGTADASVGIDDFWFEPCPDGTVIHHADFWSVGCGILHGDINILDHFTLNEKEYTVTSIGHAGFASTPITSVSIPETVTNIKSRAFWNCTALSEVVLPSSVTSIGYAAFGCPQLTEVVSYIEEPFPTNGFDDVMGQATLRVPAGTREKYLAAGWNFSEIVEMDGEEQPGGLTAEQELQLVKGSNGFAFSLFRGLRGGKSMVLSPLSVTYALSLLNNGAEGQTRREISDALGFGDAGMDAVNAFCRKMLTQSGQLDSLTQVETANAVFVNQPHLLLPGFQQTAEQYYDATARSLDFADRQSLAVINQWASDHTHGMIPRVLGRLEPGCMSYLLNAVYFKGAWTQRFDPAETASEPFGGKRNRVQMMHLKDNMYYGENDTYQVLQLPYGNRSYLMTVLLPREGKTIDDVLSLVEGTQWQRACQVGCEMVDVKLPRMDVDTDVQLTEVLKGLGIQRAFAPDADFPYFCDMDSHIDRVSQKARLKLDEEGTEASAVTVTVVVPGDEGGEDTPGTYEFHADRPFLYVISEQSSGLVYFIGQFTGNAAGPDPDDGIVGPSTRWEFREGELGKTDRQLADSKDRKQELQVKQEMATPGYGVQGRRQNGTPQRGIYIRDGRKVLK